MANWFFMEIQSYFYVVIFIFLPSLGSEMSLNIMLFCSKFWWKILMGVCYVSLIIFDKIPCKMFSDNSWNYGFLSVSPQENWLIKNKNFHGAAQSNNVVFAVFNLTTFFCYVVWVFSCIVLQSIAKIPWFIS